VGDDFGFKYPAKIPVKEIPCYYFAAWRSFGRGCSGTCLVFCLTFLPHSSGESIPTTDHLIPIETVDQRTGRLVDKHDRNEQRYFQVLQQRLFLTPADTARCVVMPAFEPEFVISVYTDQGYAADGPIHHATLTKAAHSFYHTLAEGKNPKDVTVNEYDAVLDADTARAIRESWRAMLVSTRSDPRLSNYIGTDTDRILVSCTASSGSTRWGRLPPNGGRRVRILANMADLLFRLCEAPSSSRRGIETKIRESSAKLLRTNSDR
jgi:hypothetical protein